jgi:hypothetical protein
MIGVRTDLPAYRSAVAELPLSACRTSEPAGAIVVVDGSAGWTDAAGAALRAGAAGVVVADPVAASPDALAALAALAEGVPVILDRARLRADAAATAGRAAEGTAPAIVVATCAAGAAELPEALRDAVGWLRVLSSGPVSLRSSRSTALGAVALFDAGATSATLVASILSAGAAEPRLRLVSSAPMRVEVAVGARAAASVAVTDAGGRRTLPEHLESRQRLSLRRAVAAVEADEVPRDVEELAADLVLAAALGRPGIDGL